MDMFESFIDKNQQPAEEINAKEVISRVMSKAEIKKQAIKSNNKDYFLDFIEEQPVREYSKEPVSNRLNLELDFKKKKSEKEVSSFGNKPNEPIDFFKDNSLSTEQYLDKLFSHLGELKVVSSSKINTHKNIGMTELNQLNSAFDYLLKQISEIQTRLKSNSTLLASPRHANVKLNMNSKTTPTRIIREKPQRIDSSPSPLVHRRTINRTHQYSSSPRSINSQNVNSKILLTLGNQSSTYQRTGSNIHSTESARSQRTFTKPTLAPSYINNPPILLSPDKEISRNKVVSSSAQNLIIKSSYESQFKNQNSQQGFLFSKNSPQIISTPALHQLPPRKIGAPLSVRRNDSSSPGHRIRVDGTLYPQKIMGFSSRPSSRTMNSTNQGVTQSYKSYTPRNTSREYIKREHAQQTGVRVISSTQNNS